MQQTNCIIIIKKGCWRLADNMTGYWKFEDKHTILKTQTQQNQSFRPSGFIYSFFFLLPHLNLSERPCFWLTDLQPHLVTRSCCQHSFSEKSSCQTTLPWSAAKTRKRVRGSESRETESLAAWLANCCVDRTEPSQSGVGSLVWRVCDERKKPSRSQSETGERNREILNMSSRNERFTA